MRLQTRLALSLVLAAAPLFIGAQWWRNESTRQSRIGFLRDYARGRIDTVGREACEEAPARLRDPWFRGRTAGRRGFGMPWPYDAPSPTPGLQPREPAGAAASPDAPPGEVATTPSPLAGSRNPPGMGGGGFGGFNAFGRTRSYELWAYDRAGNSSDPNAPPFPVQMLRELAAGDPYPSMAAKAVEGPQLLVAVRSGWDEGPCALVLASRTELAPDPREDDSAYRLLGLIAFFLLVVWLAAGPIVTRIRRLEADVRVSAARGYESPVPVDGKDEIADLALAFNDAGSQLRQRLQDVELRDRSLRNFLANTTHDVMVPLSVLQGCLADLERRAREQRPADSATVASAMGEAQYIGSLVHNLGAVARLEAADGALHRHLVDWNGLVERVVQRHRPFARARGVTLDHAVPERMLSMLGDATLLEQAVSNIVHNAIRHNRAGGHAAVVLEESGADRFTLRVLDDGPGVTDAELARLGERAFRSDAARTRSPEGHGLGLHIAHEVAARHGLSLRFTRASEGGLEAILEGAVERANPELSDRRP